jgi:thiol:disulfide interchange protein
MKWVTKLQDNNLQESNLNKGITSKIKEFKELQNEIAELEGNRSQVEADDVQEFENDLTDLKQELSKIDDAICLAIDKKIEKAPMMAEKVAKMQEARKNKSANGGQAPAPKPAQQEKQTQTQTQQAPSPKPAQQQASGGQVEEKKGTNWGSVALGVLLVGLTGGLAYKYFKNK